MATSEVEDKVKDIKGLLTCTICLETFTNPKYLPCLHTFCESCIQTYITSGFEEGKTESFECPLCRGQVQSPTKNITTEEWAKFLPMNNLISGLVEKQKLIKSEKVCMLCERMSGDTSSAASFICIEYGDTLCESCERYHRSIKLTSKHNIKRLDNLQSSDIPLSTFTNCAVHKGKKLKFYCSDHESPCCSTCVSVSHRKCEKVDTLEDAAKNVAKSQTVLQLKEKIDVALKDVTSVLENQTDSLKALEKQYENECRKIGDVFESLRNNLSEQEALRKAELLKRCNEAKDQIETIVVVFENAKKVLQNEKTILEIGSSEASVVDFIIEIPKLVKQADIVFKRIQDYSWNLQSFELVVENGDTKLMGETLKRTCIVRCDEKSCPIKLININIRGDDANTYTFSRFSSLGTLESCWEVKSKVDAISFTVSENIILLGLSSYGPKDTETCRLEAKVFKGDNLLTTVITSLEDKTYENKITKLFLEHPVKLTSGVKYDIGLTMTGAGLCYYGNKGISVVECDGVTVTFLESATSNNGTRIISGQIPGFIFRKS